MPPESLTQIQAADGNHGCLPDGIVTQGRRRLQASHTEGGRAESREAPPLDQRSHLLWLGCLAPHLRQRLLHRAHTP